MKLLAPEPAAGVQGGDCFGTFMQSGLPKHILKDIWAVVAGDVGRLTMPQFLSCMYLLDLAKRGKVRIPKPRPCAAAQLQPGFVQELKPMGLGRADRAVLWGCS